MNKRFTNRLLSLALAWWLITTLAIPMSRAEPTEAVAISTVGEFQQFAKNCSLDVWSQGKTVVLTADLDLAGADFAPIPTFGGVFLGQGHTISGLRLTGPGSAQGLFRYLQPDGVVQDLTVKGTVAPEGTRSAVGGIVGDNAGTLQNCTFQGLVQGDEAVGGIAGENRVSGRITGCTAYGSVSGGTATGGITGRNAGLLLNCENNAGINLTQTQDGLDILEAGSGSILEERTAGDGEAFHLLNSSSDTGGIAGHSSGVVEGCVNNGAVGYPHVGYNTGGIAGRQCGYLAGCVNNGIIHGRKDVGGIVGQAEPYLVIDTGQDSWERLRAELDTLDRLINRALDGAQRTGDEASLRLEAMGGYADDARDSSEQVLDQISSFTDGNIDTINTLTADITRALEKISPALDDLSNTGGQLERLSGQLEGALESLDGAVGISAQVLNELRAAAKDLEQSRRQLGTAADKFRQALEAWDRFRHPGQGGGGIALPSLNDLKEARENLRRAFTALKEAGNELDGALTRLSRALEEARPLPGKLEDVLAELQDAAGSSASIGRLLRRAMDAIGGAVDELTREGPAQFTPLGEDFRQAGDGLFDALAGLSGEMEGLRDVLQNGGGSINADLRAVSRQFNVVFSVTLDALGGLSGGDDAQMIQDTSEQDIDATREGKIYDCRNTGSVEGDRNVGGAAGAVAIELDLDPEDDRADLFSFGTTYETKAVLQNCVNNGSVTAKKDCVGGLAGRMDLGTALDCQNYGPISSTGGDYVGGVAGYADASVRSCYVKSPLSGKNYVGGIAGWASCLRDCCSIAVIDQGTEFLGAVAGGVEADGVLTGNRFVDTGTAGVDGVSYAGRAEPVPFAELAGLPGVPPELTAFSLTLMAGEEVAAQIPFLYGDDLSRLSLPPVPEREGYYGMWPEFDTSGTGSDLTLEAVYTPWATVAASQELSGKLSLALAEGRFTEDAVLHVQDSSQAPPSGAEGKAVVWDVSLTGVDLEEGAVLPLRLLNQGGGKAVVWQYQDDQWRQVEAVQNGQYLLVEMEGLQGSFCIQPQPGVPWTLVGTAAGAAALLALLAAAGRQLKKKKAAKAAKAREAQETAAKR